jgi:hypothetical protein
MRTGNIWNFANRDDVATVRRLLSEGVPADLTNKVGWTPLHAAAAGGAERVLTLLCQRGVAVDPRCHAGRTPLMDAARHGHLACVKAVVKSGARIGLLDTAGLCALDQAKGEAVRAWLSYRTPGSAEVAPPRSAKPPRGKKPDHRDHGGGGFEAVAERQKVGVSQLLTTYYYYLLLTPYSLLLTTYYLLLTMEGGRLGKAEGCPPQAEARRGAGDRTRAGPRQRP